MSKELCSCVITSPIDRIRGSQKITLVLECKYLVNEKYYTVSGMGYSEEEDLEEAYQMAFRNAEKNLDSMVTVKAGNSKLTTTLMREMITPSVTTYAKKVGNKDELSRLYEVVGEDKQRRINNLCEALGIDTIPVLANEWTMIEALVLIEYLERMTDSIGGPE